MNTKTARTYEIMTYHTSDQGPHLEAMAETWAEAQQIMKATARRWWANMRPEDGEERGDESTMIMDAGSYQMIVFIQPVFTQVPDYSQAKDAARARQRTLPGRRVTFLTSGAVAFTDHRGESRVYGEITQASRDRLHYAVAPMTREDTNGLYGPSIYGTVGPVDARAWWALAEEEDAAAEAAAELAAERRWDLAHAFPGDYGPHAGPDPEDARERELEEQYWRDAAAAEARQAERERTHQELVALARADEETLARAQEDLDQERRRDLLRRLAAAGYAPDDWRPITALPEAELEELVAQAERPDTPFEASLRQIAEDARRRTIRQAEARAYPDGATRWSWEPGRPEALRMAQDLVKMARERWAETWERLGEDPDFVPGYQAWTADQAAARGLGTWPVVIWEGSPEFSWTTNGVDLRHMRDLVNGAPGFSLEPVNGYALAVIYDGFPF